MSDILMPKLSDAMEEATVLRWLKQPGEAVAKGEPLVEVETDKATMVYEAEFDGMLVEIVIGDGGIAALGAVIARTGSATAVPAARAVARPEAVAGSEIEFREAIRQALDEELERDERVIFFGEDVARSPAAPSTRRPGCARSTATSACSTRRSPSWRSPVRRSASAVTGLRPVVEIMFGDFLALAMDSLVNQSTKYWYLTQERQSVPLTIRSVVGAGGRFGAIHSQMPVSWFMGVPGLKIVAPSTPADAKGLLKSAIRDDNPVLFFEHKRLYTVKGEVGRRARPARQARASSARAPT